MAAKSRLLALFALVVLCVLLHLATLHQRTLRVQRLLHAVRSQRPQVMQAVRVVAPKSELEGRFLASLTEDRAQTSMSYVEFLCHVHRQIQAKFT